jgi:hypothetical protein
VGRSPYQSEKRRKELARLKKQEEKRQRRFNKKQGENPDGTPVEGVVMGPDGLPMQDGTPAAEGPSEDSPDGGQPPTAKDEQGPGQSS